MNNSGNFIYLFYFFTILFIRNTCAKVTEDINELEDKFEQMIIRKSSFTYQLRLFITQSSSDPICLEMNAVNRYWLCHLTMIALKLPDYITVPSPFECKKKRIYHVNKGTSRMQNVLPCPVKINNKKKYLYISYDKHKARNNFDVFVYDRSNNAQYFNTYDELSLYKHVSDIHCGIGQFY